ncbi:MULTISPECIES: helix-turn-helix transcriptional regulator [Paracoccus]|uniref:Helix-turn-helix domain-containing protein n=2 Tax=Paracoccus TaxID=265 RepID=A0A844GYK0_9RHOB|nr:MULTISPECIES: helix-turn-helix transcriptional regulator [Paracoccus]MTH33572.1 helix-turn-helix domain-containing protein [Paracoccus limosus]MTH63374.1 helix-turn-helix domain-containing protein [Paracoccus shanxieyensis]MTH86295.1 helix-turn-helix domain-containing protein [Paracoccus shanxieyensis]
MDALRTTRRQLGLTQASVAASAGISLPTLRALERGSGGVRALVALMAVLDLRWGWAPDRVQAARALADRRVARGLSQAQLAARIGVSRPVIIALERDLGATVATVVRAAAALGIKRVLRANPAGRRGLVPATNAPAQDLVMTPLDLAAAVIAHFAGRMTGKVLDPARGQGAFHRHFPAHLHQDWCEITEGRDFLDWQGPVDWVMTNPPWSRLRDFTRHAMRIAPNIVWLAPLTNLTTKARLRDLDEAGFGIAELVLIDTPNDWPQSGFQLVAAWLRKGHSGGWSVTRLAEEAK